MKAFETPLGSVDADRITEYMAELKDDLRTAPDPNVVGPDGRTCLLLALGFCVGDDGEELVESLLDRGADPNRPSALANFMAYMNAANTVRPLERLIRAGLAMNDVYSIEPGRTATGRGGRFTLLDYALDVQAFLSRTKPGLERLAKKHAGSLTGRRRFVADTVAVLEANGATRSA